MDPSPALNLATLLERSARAVAASARGGAGARACCTTTRRSRAARARMAASMRDAGLAPGDRVLRRLAQRARLRRGAVRLLVGGARRGAGEQQAAREGARVRAGGQRRPAGHSPTSAGAKRSRADKRAPTRVERIVELGGAEHDALCVGSRIATASADIAAVASTTPAWLFYTSGTTGRPKGVVISHGNLVAMAQAFLSDVEAVSPGDALLHPAPLSHGSGLYLVPHVARGAVNVVPESGGFDADEIVALLDAWDRALFFAAPTMVRAAGARTGDRARAARSAEVHRVRRRSDVRRGLQGGVRGAGSPARADLRPGRIADDDHRDGPRARRRCDRARRRCADRLGRRRAARRRAAHRGRRRPRAARRRDRRSAGARRDGDAGLLAQSVRHRGDARRRLAAHGRPRRPRRATAS